MDTRATLPDTLEDRAQHLRADATRIYDMVDELMAPPSWHRDAACRGQGTDRFFPEGRGPLPREITESCERCPVTVQCADAGGRQPGTWGGLSQSERVRRAQALRRAG